MDPSSGRGPGGPPPPSFDNGRDHSLPQEIQDLIDEIDGHAREFGLDYFPTVFEMLDYDEINEFAARGGFPTRYPHWRFGMDYEQLSKGYTYGLQKIYEMVINNNPCYAYLLKCNHLTDQKLVIGHVFAHNDFFKNNLWFAHTNRKMLDTMANHATRVRRYIERYGVEKVERFIDACLSLENLIDPQSPVLYPTTPTPAPTDPQGSGPDGVFKLHSQRGYMDTYINPPEFIEAQRKRQQAEEARARRFPERPERDVLLFLLENAPLERWEQDVLSIVRDEAYYFAPQGQTKIMNEGWATYWHTRIMTERAMKDSEVIHYADANAGVLATAPGGFNPYKLGVELYRDIQERWDKGRFGREWEECDDLVRKQRWDTGARMGIQKIFEVRRIFNDLMFVDEFLTEEFCHRQKLFLYDYNPHLGQWVISNRKFADVKKRLLFMLANHGQPRISVTDGNHQNRGELYLLHDHEGVDLQPNYAALTLANLAAIWRRPVALETVVQGIRTLLSHDGNELTQASLKRGGKEP